MITSYFMKTILYIFFLSFLFTSSASADFKLGVDAYIANDYVTAYKELKPFAEQGNADAQQKLGYMYVTGQGVTQDYKEAVKWYRLAALQGNADAQHNLGISYDIGEGVTQDYKEAAKWFRLAAHQGNVHAHYNLGWLYWQGKGVIKNYVLSHMLFNIAAIYGDQEGEKARAALEIQIKSKEKIARAKKLARECIENHYKNCRL